MKGLNLPQCPLMLSGNFLEPRKGVAHLSRPSGTAVNARVTKRNVKLKAAFSECAHRTWVRDCLLTP